ncbi:MAG: hypothetical protein ACE5HO_19595 [bacterium]
MVTFKTGDVIAIHANIRKAQDVYGFALCLVYPLSAIQIIQTDGNADIIQSDFLGADAVFFSKIKQDQENDLGIIKIGYSMQGNQPAKSGEGRMFSIRARTLKPGQHPLIWTSNSAIVNLNQEELKSTFENFTLHVDDTKDSGNEMNVVYITVEQDTSD